MPTIAPNHGTPDDAAPRPLTGAELASLRAEMRASGHKMRARLRFAKLIRTRLLGDTRHAPGQARHREFADDYAFLTLTLHKDAVAEVRFGVRDRRDRHTVGHLLCGWDSTFFASRPAIRACLQDEPCELFDLWKGFEQLHCAELPPIEPQAWRELR